MSIGVGTHQSGRDLGTIDRAAGHAQPAMQHTDIEAGEMEKLGDGLVGEQGPQTRRFIDSARALPERTAESAPDGSRFRRRTIAPGTSRSRSARSPVVSVSTATVVPKRRPSGRSPSCNSMRTPSGITPVRLRRSAGEGDAGAQEKTRTSTALRPLAPEASASANSATWAIGVTGDSTYERAAPLSTAFPSSGYGATAVDAVRHLR